MMDDEPKSGRRRKAAALPALPEKRAADREALAAWMREQHEAITAGYEQRIAQLRAAPDHPSPVYANMVKKFAGIGLSKGQIGSLLDITVHTLMNYYDREFELGSAEVVALVGAKVIQRSLSDEVDAGRIGLAVLEKLGGERWKPPTQKVEMETKRQDNVIDSSKMSAEDRQMLREIIQRQLEKKDAAQSDADDAPDAAAAAADGEAEAPK